MPFRKRKELQNIRVLAKYWLLPNGHCPNTVFPGNEIKKPMPAALGPSSYAVRDN